MSRVYLVRFGIMHHVGRFFVEGDFSYRRGDTVVVRSQRGTELGEVLAEDSLSPRPSALLLRRSEAQDRERAIRAERDKARRLSTCEQFFSNGQWPIDLIDVEPMLDDLRTVAHYLGPHRLNASALLQAVRETCGLDLFLEPVGHDEPSEEHGCGECGSHGGGCGTGCGSGESGCSGCAVKSLVTQRSPASALR